VPLFESANIRNIALIGHRGSGKTTLVEAMLFTHDEVSRLGSVDAGQATTDFDDEEKARKISISPALAHVHHDSVKLNLVDTPGYAEFFAEVLPCLAVVDAAMLVIDGVAGVEVHTRKVFATAREMGIPLVCVINKLDKEHSNYEAALDSIREALPGVEVAPIHLPIGSESSFSGIVDLLSNKAITGDSKSAKQEEIPAEMAEEVTQIRAELVEAVAAADDELMEKYFENDTLSEDELIRGLKAGLTAGRVMPVMCASALNNIGVGAVMDFVAEACPSPLERPAMVGTDPGSGQEVTRECDSNEPFSAIVFKTFSDPYVGRLSLIRIVSGIAQSDMTVVNGASGEREKLSGLSVTQGRELRSAGTLAAGDLGCVTKLEHTGTGDTLCDPKSRVVYKMPNIPIGMHAVAMQAATRTDQDKLSTALARLAEEDVGFTFERSEDTGELVVHGMGPLHIEVIVSKLKRMFDVDVNLTEPKVPYRETATKSVRVQGRHKKQTGGRGQFGDVWIRLDPLPRGAGYQFVNEVKGGAVPTNFIPAVEKGLQDGLASGPLAGYPVVDVKVTLDDGSSHPVDSSDIAFRLAGQIAIRKAMEEANPILLEPIVTVTITTPADLIGDIISDLSSRRGRPQDQVQLGGGMVMITAQVPYAEMRTYAADLRSISQGRASYTMELSHYEEMPAYQAERVIAEAKAAQEKS